MGMNVKAIERKIAYLGKEGGKDQYMYVMQPLIYNKLTPEKAIQQAALDCSLTPYSHRSLFRFDKLYVSRDVKLKPLKEGVS